MKIKILSFIVLSSLLSACVKDPTVTSPELGARLKARAESKKNPTESLRMGQFSGVALLAEKQIEALEILRLSLPTQSTSDIKYTREVLKEMPLDGGALVQSIQLKSDREGVLFNAGADLYTAFMDKQWDVTSKTVNGKLTEVKATKLRRKNPKGGVGKIPDTYANISGLDKKDPNDTTKKGDSSVRLNEDELDIIATLADDGETLNVQVTAKTFLIATRSGVKMSGENYDLTLAFKVNVNAVMNDEMIVTQDLKGSMIFSGKSFKIVTSSPEMKVRLQSLCNDLEGSAVIEQDRGNKRSVIFTKTGVSVSGSSKNTPVAECGKRLNTDFVRFLDFL